MESYSTIGNNLVEDAKMSARNVNVFYGDKQAILMFIWTLRKTKSLR